MIPLLTLNTPLFIKWYITGRCNLRCKHCYLSSYHGEGSLTKILNIVDELAEIGVKDINFLGGEPLIRKDLEAIVRHTAARGIHVKIGTNGTLLTKKRVESLLSAGCYDFQISIEGMNAEINDEIRGANSFHKAMTGVKRLLDKNANTEIAMTLNQKNFNSIFGFCQSIYASGIRKVKFSVFMPLGSGALESRNLMLNTEHISTIKNEISDIKRALPDLIVLGAFNPAPVITHDPVTLGCGAGTSTMVINNDLTVSACDLWTNVDRTERKIEKKGDVIDIWQNDELFNKWRRINPENNNTKFNEVHEHGCHILYMQYNENIFER